MNKEPEKRATIAALMVSGLLLTGCSATASAAQSPTFEHSPEEVTFLQAAAECEVADGVYAHSYGNALTANPTAQHSYSVALGSLDC